MLLKQFRDEILRKNTRGIIGGDHVMSNFKAVAEQVLKKALVRKI